MPSSWRVPYLCYRHCAMHRSGLFLRFIVGPKTKSEFEEINLIASAMSDVEESESSDGDE